MPGPKMGARPADFDEEIVRQSPTFVKWMALEPGQKLRYACRDFIKAHAQDEERLMRRIMIARRNNLKDHETLKRARQTTGHSLPPTNKRITKRRLNGGLTDAQVMKEMDVAAVEATRSYRSWMALGDGKEFVYNQTYIKGKESHDWLLRKNIWRRMRYRRENKRMVERMKGYTTADGSPTIEEDSISAAAGIVDHALESEFVNKAVVEAAVAAAESYVKGQGHADDPISSVVHNPLESATNEALDAAAKLAAAAVADDPDGQAPEPQRVQDAGEC